MIVMLVALLFQGITYVPMPEVVPDTFDWPSTLDSAGKPIPYLLPSTDAARKLTTDDLLWFRRFAEAEGICPESGDPCPVRVHYRLQTNTVANEPETQLVGQVLCQGPLGSVGGIVWYVRQPHAVRGFISSDKEWTEYGMYDIPYYRLLKSFHLIQKHAIARAKAPEMRR